MADKKQEAVTFRLTAQPLDHGPAEERAGFGQATTSPSGSSGTGGAFGGSPGFRRNTARMYCGDGKQPIALPRLAKATCGPIS